MYASINALLKVLSAAAIAEVSPLNLEAIDSMPTLAFCTEPEKSVGESKRTNHNETEHPGH